MLDIGKIYWFVVKNYEGKKISIKGKVVAENNEFVKLLRDSGNTSFIKFAEMFEIKEVKGQENLIEEDKAFTKVLGSAISKED